MTEPLTEHRFNEIQAMEPADHTPQEIGTATLDLVREIHRLRHSLKQAERSHLATLAGACMALGLPKGTAEPDVFEAARRLRAELAQARAAWCEVHEALIQGRSPSAVMDLMDRRERAQMTAAPACACGAEQVHQNGCEDGQ